MTDSKTFDVVVSDVIFEPSARNSWHSHPGGQILIATAGKGYYQEKGKPIQVLKPGDVIAIAPDVKHWHGAAPRQRIYTYGHQHKGFTGRNRMV